VEIKLNWLQRAIKVNEFHRRCVMNKVSGEYHSIRDTAELLSRSVGSVSEDLLICSWLRTYPTQIESFHTASEALKFIRDKRKELRIRA
jgi:hypothetical protein